ncbi:EF hand domain-containing protein [Rhodovulum imhoffii]|uniref:EF hand domain-containing protein n=1 Tax=Rhodovulum imhoffii TaxID=365340 RepID=A0A2T5BPY0_9RHOB|nr:calcium-binding protein [Rhodovulum imhoffii]MBK5933101.1 hypothetical protein [Rhodovulum imhoffii]PTN01148.1 EF hand domain-containing protein [Rhodovulum imhoffii]
MKKFVPALAAVVLAAGAAVAQVEDVDGDGVYSLDEILAVYPDLTEETFAEIDTNADGVVDADEMAAAVEAGLLGA